MSLFKGGVFPLTKYAEACFLINRDTLDKGTQPLFNSGQTVNTLNYVLRHYKANTPICSEMITHSS